MAGGVADERAGARLKTGLTVLIGFAALVGAVVTWHTSQVGNAAGGHDATSVAQELTAADDRARASVAADAEATLHAELSVDRGAAAGLRDVGSPEAVAEARALERDVADRERVTYLDPAFVDPETGAFDREARRDALAAGYPREREEVEPRPDVAADAADDERDHALRLSVVIFLLASAIFAMTVAELVGGRTMALAGGAGAVLLVVALVRAGAVW
jgi:hypothetical protein